MKKWVLRSVAGLAILGLAYCSLVITPFGHRSVIWSVGGVSYDEREPGLSLVFPFVQRYHKVDVREQRLVTVNAEGKANAVVHSSDLQEIFVRASLIWNIAPGSAAEVMDGIGGVDQVLAVITPIFYDAIKEVGGGVAALGFAGDLGHIAADVEAIVEPQLKARGIEVRAVALEDAVFDGEFMQSVKNKVIALEREKETETLKDVADNEAFAIRARGSAEADVQNRLARAITPETVCYELAKQGVRCVPDVVAGDAPLIYDLPASP